MRLVLAMLSWVTGIMDAHAALPWPGRAPSRAREPPFAAIAVVVPGGQVSIAIGQAVLSAAIRLRGEHFPAAFLKAAA